jgi:hypothetical protein
MKIFIGTVLIFLSIVAVAEDCVMEANTLNDAVEYLEDAKENGTLDDIRSAVDEVEDAQENLNQCLG